MLRVHQLGDDADAGLLAALRQDFQPLDSLAGGTVDHIVLRDSALMGGDANDVMREQLDYLIEHAEGGPCGCAQCLRYQRARSVLLEVFG